MCILFERASETQRHCFIVEHQTRMQSRPIVTAAPCCKLALTDVKSITSNDTKGAVVMSRQLRQLPMRQFISRHNSIRCKQHSQCLGKHNKQESAESNQTRNSTAL